MPSATTGRTGGLPVGFEVPGQMDARGVCRQVAEFSMGVVMSKLIPILFAVGTALAAGPASTQVTVLNHATVIDVTGRPAIQNATIVIDAGEIKDIGPTGSVAIPRGAEVVNLTGKTIMPGIINLHGHVGMVKGLNNDIKNFTRENIGAHLRTYSSYGVTTTSLGTDLDLMVAIRDEQRRGQLNGARIFTALQGFTFLDGCPTHVPGVKGVAQEVGTAAEARARVDRLAEKGVDIVKMWVDSHHGSIPKLPPPVYIAIIDQVHKRGINAFAHVYELSDAKRLTQAGIDVLVHSVRDAAVDAELIEALKRNNVTTVATLTHEQATFVYADPPAWLDDPFFMRGTTPEMIEAVKTTLRERQAGSPDAEINRKGFDIAMRNLKTLADAGVRIGFGTDT